jgi:ketosteroid isomerase-like protein
MVPAILWLKGFAQGNDSCHEAQGRKGAIMQRCISVLILLTGFVPCLALQNSTPPPKQQPPMQQSKTNKQQRVEKELRDRDIEFSKETAARRLEGWMDFFADDAAIIRDGKVIVGKQSIRELYAPLFADQSFNLSWTPTKIEVSKDGTLGYTYGDFEAKSTAHTSRGIYVTAWRKQNGKWMVVLDLGSEPRLQPKEVEKQ